MYCLVLRQLSPIQKGIQAAHAVTEYGASYHRTSEFLKWRTVDKTMIVLDGGTYREMRENMEFLDGIGMKYEVFHEPDLDGMITCVAMLVGESVWDERSYPAGDDDETDSIIAGESDDFPEWMERIGGINNLRLRMFLKGKEIVN